jgi:diguanylate cyclase (GGDEF)-like protein/PAS domain S-box-containing protein
MTELAGPNGVTPRSTGLLDLADMAEREARFRVLFENASDVGVVADEDGLITYVTPSVTDAFGFQPEDLLGHTGYGLALGIGPDQITGAASNILEPGAKTTFTAQIPSTGGKARWVDVTVQNLVEHPAVRGYVANIRDVTERMETLAELRAARAQQAAILNRSHDLTMFFESDGTIAWVSPNCVNLFGVDAGLIIGLNGMEMIDEDDRERVVMEFAGILNHGESFRTRFRVTDGQGRTRWVEEIATNLLDDPNVGYVVGNLRDITEEHAATDALAASEARHRLILDTAQEGIWVTDPDGRTVFANPRMAAILGASVTDLEAGSMLDFVDPDERPVVTANDAMSERGEVRRYETVLLRPDRLARWVIVSSAPLTDASGGGPGVDILHMMTDITDRKRDEAELRRITMHDALTGLPNRRLLTDRLARTLHHGDPRPTAILYLNIDNFKDVNDSRGHDAGDEVLTEIARRLRRAARSQDTVARSGGDEFLVLSEDVAGIDEVVTLAERLRAALKGPIRTGDAEFVVTASIGVAMSPPTDAAELIRGAGIAMYRAKEDGRDAISVFDHHNESEVQERLRIQAELREAIVHEQFEVWYQPIVSLENAAVRGVEALVRWRHPTRGLLLPGAFMDVAESTGLIREIGLWVLETACRDATEWRDPDHALGVSVNVSGLQLVDNRLCTQVAEIMARTGIDREQLTLEVTESAAMRDQVTAERNMRGLQSLGVRLALDDFGTGYSSLSFLRGLPVEVVKIDQSFVAGLGERKEDELIVAGVISMAHALGHTVIAEGIETMAQLRALRRLGCRYGQGFLWSRAVPRIELAPAIRAIELDRDEYLATNFALQ